MPGETKQMTADDLGALFDAFDRHDVKTVLSFMTEDCVFNAAGGPDVHGTRIVGHEAVGAAFGRPEDIISEPATVSKPQN